MKTRRSFLATSTVAAAGTAFGLCASSSAAFAADKVTMLTANGFQPDFIDLLNASSGGHFSAQGIEAEVVGPNGTSQAAQILLGGKAKFAKFSGLDILKSVGKIDAPFLCISTMAQASTFHVISTPERPIAKGEDLKDKKVGVVSVGGTTDTYIDLILHKVGLPLDSVEKRAVGNSPAAFEFVKRGMIDCCTVSLQVILALQDAKEKFVSWNTDRYAPVPGQCYLTMRDVAEKQPDLVVRFLRALKASVDELMTKPVQPIFQRARKDFEIPNLGDLDSQAAIVKAVAERQWLSEGRENLMRNVPRLWQEGAAAAQALGLGTFGDGTRVYTNTFVDAALKS